MSSMLLTPPNVEPLTLAEAKAWLRLDTSDEDATVTALIAAARIVVEQAAQRLLIRQTWRVLIDCWPADGRVRLPLLPVVSVTAVRVRAADGSPATVPPTSYRLDAAHEPAELALVSGVAQPGLPRGGIEIDVLCGFAEIGSGVPEPLRQAMRLLIARWFERRGDVPDDATAISADVAMLTAPFRRPRV